MLSAAVLRAQSTFTIDWSSITSGSTASPGTGECSLTGSVGQLAPGIPAGGAAGSFSLTGGYWAAEESPMELGLAMQRTGNTVTLTWDGSRGIPVVLEQSADMRTWVPVSPQPTGASFTENIATVSRRSYRLRRAP